jgi:hypothetical protein
VIRNILIAVAVATAPAAAVALPVVTVGDHTPAAVAQARPAPDPSVYCGPGYYPPKQYGGRCVRVKHLALGRPSIFKPWTWRFAR